MRWLHRFLPGRRRREIDDEIAAHLDLAVRDRIDRGEDPAEARLAALREFGNVPLVADTTRRVWTSTTLEQVLQDLRFGVRILWQAPGVSGTAVLLIALVIGGNTTVYSLVRGILTSPATGVTASRLVGVGQVSPESMRYGAFASYPDYLDYATGAQTVRGLVAWGGERMTIGVHDGSYAVFGAPVTPGFFETLGVRIAAGRSLTAADDRLDDGGLVAVISDRLWRDRFAQSSSAIGRSIQINGRPVVIVGVAAPGFRGANLTPGEDVWLPIAAFHQTFGSRHVLEDRRLVSVLIVGRLDEGRSLSEATAEFAALSEQIRAAFPNENADRRAIVFDYSVTAFLPVATFAPRFLAIFSIVTVLTLLVVAANVANLMLARAVVRQRDTAVRQSLGASRGRIVRMLVAEGLAVSITAWAAACLLAWWMAKALVGLLEPARRGLLPDFRPDWVVAAYAMALAVAATLAFTLAPALNTWRQQVLPWLKAGEPSVAAGRSRLSSALVVVQLAFCALLLTSAGLAYRSLSLLDSGNVGFEQEQFVIVTLRTGRSGNLPPEAGIDSRERTAALLLLERLRAGIGALPGVVSVSYSQRAPGAFLLSGAPVWRDGVADPASAFFRPVGPEYLRVLGLSPLTGRDISSRDTHGATSAAVVNANLAGVLFPGISPIGQTLRIGADRAPVEIVGIAPNALYDGPSQDPKPNFVFVAMQQRPGQPMTEPKYLVRYRGSLDPLVPAIGRAVTAVDPQVPIVSVQTMAAALGSVKELEQQVATLLTVFAVGSFVIAALGQYAITAFNMRRRTRDFGVRLALGAASSTIRQSVVAEALRLTVVGLTIGFGLSAAAGTAFRSVLFGVTPTDPVTYAGVGALLGTASLIAAYLPAWRAGRVNVVDALRQE